MVLYMDIAIFFLSFLLVLIIFAVISLLFIVNKGISTYIDTIENLINRGKKWLRKVPITSR